MTAAEKIITFNYSSPVGELILGSYGGSLCLCDWRYRKMRKGIDARLSEGLGAEYSEGNTQVIKAALGQLEEYFAGSRKEFSIPLLTVGTPFQKTVWEALAGVPYGTTLSYSGLAGKTGNAAAVRAVAAANGANAISIFLPCHRIIGAGGDLTGYAGGVNAKRKLLELEAADGFQQTLDFS